MCVRWRWHSIRQDKMRIMYELAGNNKNITLGVVLFARYVMRYSNTIICAARHKIKSLRQFLRYTLNLVLYCSYNNNNNILWLIRVFIFENPRSDRRKTTSAKKFSYIHSSHHLPTEFKHAPVQSSGVIVIDENICYERMTARAIHILLVH